MKPSAFSWPQVYLSVSLTSFATLLLELSLTRIFSVVFYYHLAFLAISIALFGLGAGGVFSYLIGGSREHSFAVLGRLSSLNGLLVALALFVLLPRGAEVTNLRLALIYFCTALPFAVSGAILSHAISETVERVDRVYFFDLAGAAAGCLALVKMLDTLNGPNTILAAGVVFAAAGAIWHSMAGSVKGRAASVALALALVVFLVLNVKHRFLDVTYAKNQKLENEIFVKWNSFSRIAVAPERGSGMMTIFIDADASTGIANFDYGHLSERDLKDLLYQGPGLPYVLRPGAKTLIIGPGGGWDVARALASGSADITGVEINPIIADVVMQRRYPHFSGNLYRRPEVRIVVEDGRSFVRRSAEKYTVIQATLVDTWASTAAGAFALSENNLYTTEAFVDYLTHLTPDGVLALTRWGFDPPRESLRLLSLARKALERLGERDPSRHVIVGREGTKADLAKWGARDTVLISRKPWTLPDIVRAREALAKAGMEAVYIGGVPSTMSGSNPFAQVLIRPDLAAFEREYPFDISAVGDNRPFFFYTVQPRDIFAFISAASRDSADYKINKAVPLLFGLLALSLLATGIILALPPLVLKSRLPRQTGVRVFLLYFLLIGAGYILIEVALIQKLVLFLGHPTYALTVVVFSMLLSSGFGSYFSGILGESKRRWMTLLGAVAALVAILGVILTTALASELGLPLWAKVAISVALISPAGFAMGMPFPAGLRRIEDVHSPSVRWAWSLNAAASVLGSVGAIFFAIYLGLLQTLLIGGVLYLGAMLLVWRQFAEEEPA
jgi:predicted membrane-bound spermidine synthase